MNTKDNAVPEDEFSGRVKLAQVLERIIDSEGINKSQLARTCDVHPMTISRILRLEVTPEFSTLVKISNSQYLADYTAEDLAAIASNQSKSSELRLFKTADQMKQAARALPDLEKLELTYWLISILPKRLIGDLTKKCVDYLSAN